MGSWRGHSPLSHFIYIIYPLLTVSIQVFYGIDPIITILAFLIVLFYFRGLPRLTFFLGYAYPVYLFGLGKPVYMALSIPIILVYPFIVGEFVGGGLRPSGFIGPSSRRLITLSLIYTPLVVFRPGLALFFTIQYLYLLFLLAYLFVRLRDVRVVDVVIPRNMVLNRVSKVLLGVESRFRAYLLTVSSWGDADERLLSGSESIELGYAPRDVGSLNIGVVIYAFDYWLLTSRLIGEFSREVNVAPTTLVNIRYVLRGLGALLARAGLPGVFGVVGLGEGEEGTGAGRVGPGVYGVFGGLLSGFRGFGEEGFRGARVGREYLGVREFLSGDRPRDIHWKKTVSRGEYFVKVFGGGGGGGGGSGFSLIVIGDLLASSPAELDDVTNKVLLTLYSQARRGNYSTDTILILISPFNEVLYARGSLDQVLSFYISVFQRGLVRIFYDYESVVRDYGSEDVYNLFRLGRSNLFLRRLSSVSSGLARKIYGIIQTIGYEYPPQYTYICGGPGALLRGYVELLFGLGGYRYIDYGEIVSRVEPLLVSR